MLLKTRRWYDSLSFMGMLGWGKKNKTTQLKYLHARENLNYNYKLNGFLYIL